MTEFSNKTKEKKKKEKWKPKNNPECFNFLDYHIRSKYYDRQAWANNADPDQTFCGIQSASEFTLFATRPAAFRCINIYVHIWKINKISHRISTPM